MKIQHNLSSMNSNRMYGLTNGSLFKTMEKLSSGYRINRAADDAAGLSISEKMRKQIRGLTQASQNAQDGISFIQIADGALEEVHAMLQRGNELAVKAANGTLSSSDREEINQEIDQLKKAIDQVSAATKFNEVHIFSEYGIHPGLAHVVTSNSYELEFGKGGKATVTHMDGSLGLGSPGEVSTGNALADKIANEYVPNAVNQILNNFSSLKTEIDKYTGDMADKLKMALDITYVDGPGNRLAYVTGKFYTGDQTLSELSMTVDTDDFSAADVENDSASLGKLESTIAHEMMHAVMDAAMPARMYPNGGAEDLPLWFKEGTAQLAGGGYTTGWNEPIQNIINSGTNVDNRISDFLRQYTVEDRVYGHGYLAAAYMGYLANGGGAVSAAGIASGMNKIFSRMINNPGETLEQATNKVLETEGSTKRYADIINDINNGTTAGVNFVKTLSSASKAGSVIASGGLGAEAKEVLGSSTASSPIFIDAESIDTGELKEYGPKANAFSIQAGCDNKKTNRILLKLFRMSSDDLGLGSLGNPNKENGVSSDALTMNDARNAIDTFEKAISLVSGVRSYYGAMQNRLEHTIKNLNNVSENTASSESKLRDTEMSGEMVLFSKGRILLQAGQSMLAHANQSNRGVLALLA